MFSGGAVPAEVFIHRQREPGPGSMGSMIVEDGVDGDAVSVQECGDRASLLEESGEEVESVGLVGSSSGVGATASVEEDFREVIVVRRNAGRKSVGFPSGVPEFGACGAEELEFDAALIEEFGGDPFLDQKCSEEMGGGDGIGLVIACQSGGKVEGAKRSCCQKGLEIHEFPPGRMQQRNQSDVCPF